jgi:hypothetical protein
MVRILAKTVRVGRRECAPARKTGRKHDGRIARARPQSAVCFPHSITHAGRQKARAEGPRRGKYATDEGEAR